MQTSMIKLIVLLWTSLSIRRKRQLIAAQLISLLAAMGEAVNLAALVPFLEILSKFPDEGAELPLAGLRSVIGLERSTSLYLMLTLFVLAICVSSSLRIVNIMVQLRLSAAIATDLASRAYKTILYQDYPWHVSTNQSETYVKLTKDVEGTAYVIQNLTILVANSLIIVILGGFLCILYPTIVSASLLLMATLYVLAYLLTSNKSLEDGRRNVQSAQNSIKVLQDSLGGIRDIKLDHKEDIFLDLFTEETRKSRFASARINTRSQSPRYIVEALAVFGVLLIAAALIARGLTLESVIPLIGGLSLGFYRLIQPVQICFSSVNGIISNRYAIGRILPLIIDYDLIDKKTPMRFPPIADNAREAKLVRLKDVSYRYSGHKMLALNNISLEIAKGRRYGIVGTSGSGKSTLADLIMGLLDPTSGIIYALGLEGGISKSTWQNKIGHVPQSVYLMDGTITDNIAFGEPAHKQDIGRVHECARQACIHDFIMSLPDRYSHRVGERGAKLSGGQVQRLGIARALYKSRELLILDEATSSLDSETDARVMQSIYQLKRDTTMLVVTHRLRSVASCDSIFLLKDGYLIATGSYTDLYNDHEYFRKLVGGIEE